MWRLRAARVTSLAPGISATRAPCRLSPCANRAPSGRPPVTTKARRPANCGRAPDVLSAVLTMFLFIYAAFLHMGATVKAQERAVEIAVFNELQCQRCVFSGPAESFR